MPEVKPFNYPPGGNLGARFSAEINTIAGGQLRIFT